MWPQLGVRIYCANYTIQLQGISYIASNKIIGAREHLHGKWITGTTSVHNEQSRTPLSALQQASLTQSTQDTSQQQHFWTWKEPLTKFDAGIIVKLAALACPLHLLRAISGFLRNRTARVRVGQSSSPPFTLHAGVPQGSILSPLLFIIYCWDLPCPTDPNVHQQQYADDTVCWATSNDPKDANQKLQLQLATLESWMRRWRITPNPSKTQLIQFKHRHKRPKTQPTITLWETEVTFDEQRNSTLELILTPH
ncbi:hypothetical protein CBL_11600 [Carabus blaptoides fortunei]